LPPPLALLADAHLRDGEARRAEARALARAVAEIRSLPNPPHLVLFAGDLAHDGNTNALALGKEILSDLPGTLLLVMGEGDGPGQGAALWPHLFGEPRFSQGYSGFNLLGLNTSLSPSPQGPVFALGREQRRWLARELTRLDPGKPLLVLSHAPLREIFRPWQQWTQDGQEVMHLLSRFAQVFCLHGHVHREAVSHQLSAISPDLRGHDKSFHTENRKLKTENHLFHQGLPATSWPLPSPLQGTLTAARPGLGPRGCGWGLVSMGQDFLKYQPQIWQA
jgi:3',5'-cyclic AMP phosphodiesterase CpdA